MEKLKYKLVDGKWVWDEPDWVEFQKEQLEAIA